MCVRGLRVCVGRGEPPRPPWIRDVLESGTFGQEEEREERDGDKSAERGTRGAEVWRGVCGVERETRFVPVGRGVGIFREEEGDKRVGRSVEMEESFGARRVGRHHPRVYVTREVISSDRSRRAQ